MKQYILYLMLGFIWLNKIQAQIIEPEVCIGGNGKDVITNTLHLQDGSVLIVMHTNSADGTFTDHYGSNDIAVVKFNPDMTIQWKKTYGNAESNILISVNNFENYFLLNIADEASFLNTDSSFKKHLILIDYNGNTLWQKDFISSQSVSEYINGTLKQYSYGGYIFPKHIIQLKNKSFIEFTYPDSSVVITNIEESGNIRWQHRLEFDTTILRISRGTSDLFWVTSEAYDLEDSTVVISNIIDYGHCSGWCFNSLLENKLVRIDYNGNILQEQLQPIPQYEKSYALNGVRVKTSNNQEYKYMTQDRIYKLNVNSLLLSLDSSYILPNPYFFISDHKVSSSESYGDAFQTNGQSKHINIYYTPQNDPLRYGYRFFVKDELTNQILFNEPVDSAQSIQLYSFLKTDKHLFILYGNYNIGLFLKGYLWDGREVFKTEIYDTMTYQHYLFSHFNNYSYDIYGNIFEYDSINNRLNLLFKISKDVPFGGDIEEVYVKSLDVNTGGIILSYKSNPEDSLSVAFVKKDNNVPNMLHYIGHSKAITPCNYTDFNVHAGELIAGSNKVVARAYLDYNNNQVKDASESWYTGNGVFESIKDPYVVAHVNNGDYTINKVDTGVWNTHYILSGLNFNISPQQHTSMFINPTQADTVHFALYPPQRMEDMTIQILNTFFTRAYSYSNYKVVYTNNGTHPSSGVVKVLLSSDITNISTDPAFTYRLGDTLVWDYNSINAGVSNYINIRFMTIMSSNDTLISYAWVEPIGFTDIHSADNSYTLYDVVRGSYDPNDKYCETGNNFTTTQIQDGDYVVYTIRFQNTGNDTAFNIHIYDTLDQHIDWNSFELISSSHPFVVEVIHKNILHFISNQIKLVDSFTNESLSHGYISYRVKVNKTTPSETVIHNTAHIYFDYNPGVTTQTVTVSILNVVFTNTKHKDNQSIRIYPNPNIGKFTIQFETGYSGAVNLEMYDVTGKRVYAMIENGKSSLTVDVSALPNGVYELRCATQDVLHALKIVINR